MDTNLKKENIRKLEEYTESSSKASPKFKRTVIQKEATDTGSYNF